MTATPTTAEIPGQPPTRTRPRLSWSDTSGTHAVDLAEPRTAGSAPGCNLVLPDRAVSRIHASLEPRADGLWVEDLGSRNGVSVGGMRVSGALVPNGGILRLGSTDIVVTYGPPAPVALSAQDRFGELVGTSPALREVFARLPELAADGGAVVIVGEQGSGKEAFARAIHDASSVKDHPFVVVDCAALPGLVAAAEIFEDALRSAEGGTLVLDEPSELPLALQRELVPPLDARAFRAIATTQHDLRRLVNQGSFREGLYFRLAAATLHLPPLREHPSDIGPLLRKFLGEHAVLATPDLVAELERLPWTGNVRELALYAERLVNFGVERAVPAPVDPTQYGHVALEPRGADVFDPEATVASEPTAPAAPAIPSGLEPWFEIGFKEFREKWIELGEREYLRRLMARTNRSSSVASRTAGLERTYLYRLIKKHGV